MDGSLKNGLIMGSILFAFAILTMIGPASAKDCRFVDVENPRLTITFNPGVEAVLKFKDHAPEVYETMSAGTGMSSGGAWLKGSDATDVTTFNILDYDGHTFLIWGAGLLVEKCD